MILRGLRQQTLTTQIITLSLVSVVMIDAFAATLMALLGFFKSPLEYRVQPVAAYVRALEASPASVRAHLLSRLEELDPKRDLRIVDKLPTEGVALDPRKAALYQDEGAPMPQLRLLPRSQDYGSLDLAWPMSDGSYLLARYLPSRSPGWFLASTVGSVIAFVVSTMIFLFWCVRQITRPLKRLARDAEALSLERSPPHLPQETGSLEVRAVARALTRLDKRLKTEAASHRAVIASINHDLRTPLTRLRLRAELVECPTLMQKMLSDIAQMSSMLQKSLSFLQDGNIASSATLIDVATVLQTVSDEFRDLGHDVQYHGPAHCDYVIDIDDFRRAITNLVENAVRHATSVSIALSLSLGNTIKIDISDDGPGLPDAEPGSESSESAVVGVSRGAPDQSRFGLGLSIVNSIVLSHGGRLTLRDNYPTGLVVEIIFPTRKTTVSNAGNQSLREKLGNSRRHRSRLG